MASFILSLSTHVLADESLPAVRHGLDILRRDMRAALTEGGPENVIRLSIDPALPAEAYSAHVTPEEITLRCGDDLGAAYALLSVSERLLEVKPLGWWMGLSPKRLGTVSVPCQS
ncbi:MAG: hypothetical protein IJJ60_15160, partial [Clostridia bacterium]|nr:hypothetical protein [Clostridia bacterium]